MKNSRKLQKGTCYSIFAAAMTCALAANAEDEIDLWNMSLEQLLEVKIYSASRYQQSQKEAPSITSIFTAADIQAWGATRLVDVLERLPTVIPLFSDLMQNNALLVRGENGQVNHVLTLINGQPFRSSIDGGPSNLAYLTSFPLVSIERLEFIRGPGSVLHGSNAYSAVLNIITFSPDKNSASLAYQAGSFDTQKGSVATNLSWDEGALHLAINHRDSEGWQGDYIAPGTIGPEKISINYADRSSSLYSQIKQGNLSLDVFYSDSSLIGNRLGPTRDSYQSSFINGKYQKTFHQLDIETNLGLQQEAITIDTSETDGQGVSLEFIIKGLGQNHHWLAGIKGDYNNFEMDDRFGLVIGKPELQYESSNQLLSIFGQWEYALTASSSLVLGGQFNKSRERDWDFVPRIALTQRFGPSWYGKAIYSEAYRSPTLIETDLNSAFLTGNKNLEAEKVKTIDLQIGQQTSYYDVSLASYYSVQEGLINSTRFDLQFNPETFALDVTPGKYINEGKLKFYGIELEGRLQIGQDLNFFGSASWQQNEDSEGNKDVQFTPGWMAKFGIHYQALPGLDVGLFANHVDGFKDSIQIDDEIEPLNPTPGSYTLISLNSNLNMGKLIGNPALKNLTLNLYGSNLLDESISQAPLDLSNNNATPSHSGRAWYGKMQLSW